MKKITTFYLLLSLTRHTGVISDKTAFRFLSVRKSSLPVSLYIMNMLEKIQSQLEHLSKSERKVAEVILASPDNAIHLSIAAMALKPMLANRR